MRRGVAWLPPLLWCALLFAASSFPSTTGRRFFPGADRVVHVAMYGILGLLLARALLATTGATGRRVVLLAALLGTAYGATDEFHQSFVPNREPEWGDLAADAVGAILGAGAWVAFRRGRPASVTAAAASAPGPSPRP